MVVSHAIVRQNPAYRATLLNHKGAWAKSTLPFHIFSVELYAELCTNLRILMGKIVDTWAKRGHESWVSPIVTINRYQHTFQ